MYQYANSVRVTLSSSLMYSKGILWCVCGNAAQEMPSRENALQILAVSETAQWSGSSWQRDWLHVRIWQALLPLAEVLWDSVPTEL